MFDNCDGECGATEEHSAEVDPSDTISLSATRDTHLQFAPHHYPFAAGSITAGHKKMKKTYAFSLRDQNDLEFFGHGASIRSARFFRRDFSGVHTLTGIFPTDKIIYIPVLKYDPDAYYLCEHYKKKREEEKVEMDPTGPFFWKFSKLLSPGGSLPVRDTTAKASSTPSTPTAGLDTSDVSVIPAEDADKARSQIVEAHEDANSTSSPSVEDVTDLAGDDGDEYFYESREYFSDEDGEDADGENDDGWVTADEGFDSDF